MSCTTCYVPHIMYQMPYTKDDVPKVMYHILCTTGYIPNRHVQQIMYQRSCIKDYVSWATQLDPLV